MYENDAPVPLIMELWQDEPPQIPPTRTRSAPPTPRSSRHSTISCACTTHPLARLPPPPLSSVSVPNLTHGVLAGQPELDWASSVITSVKPYFLISEIAFIILGASQLVFVVNVALGIGSPLAACFGIGVKDKEAKA